MPQRASGALKGRIAVVTGASRGIGRAIALRLARDGAAVVAGYHQDKAGADAAVAEIEAAGGRAQAVRVDLADLADIERLFDVAVARFGAVDILVNNAGTVTAGPIAAVTEAEYDRVMAVNTKGVLFALRQAGLRLRDGGRVINVSSLNTVMPEAEAAVYTGSKAAVEGFTRVAAREFAERGITVNTVSPGPVQTDLLKGNPPDVLEQIAADTPLGRLGRPSDIADVVAFLAGPDARWLTGQNLRATGGLA
ncbi:glucose 1-dehydrogenase [Marinactinospora thermotolerans]|uniref:Reductase/oxidase n=1 Tax=Marinactinospora thermotolerans TaxID=531310 RepID=I7D951_9ACTN|nr:glucose 1-dehydrogenase [Marinactinospora thermotolerans]AFO85456.1 reductase/oxidase [Marinactinospora thermotolerans]